MSEIYFSNNVDDTISIAERFVINLVDKNALIFLNGDLGAGKTHFTKGIFKGLGYGDYLKINSPTFDIYNTYEIGNLKVNHLDLYRIDKIDVEDEMWLNDLISDNSLNIIEWGNKFNFKTSKKCWFVNIYIIENEKRKIEISNN